MIVILCLEFYTFSTLVFHKYKYRYIDTTDFNSLENIVLNMRINILIITMTYRF